MTDHPKTSDPVREALVLAEKALAHAIKQIRIWHGLNLPKNQEPNVWGLYQASPEMKLINGGVEAIRSALAQPVPAKDGEQSPLEVVKQEIRDWFEVAEEEIPDGTPMAIIRTVTEQPSGLKAGHLRALIAESADATDSPRMKHLKDHTDARRYLDTGELPKPVQEALDLAESAVDRAVVAEALSDDEKDAWA